MKPIEDHHDAAERHLAARALALTLNPTLPVEEIAHRIIEVAGTSPGVIARALGRLAMRSLDSPSRAADRAMQALRRALELLGDATLDLPAIARRLSIVPPADESDQPEAGQLPIGPAA
jgi:hypothetical protein